MVIHRKTLYRCDICGKESEWVPRWIAHDFWLGKQHEHEFHVCSETCDNALIRLTRMERKKLADAINKTK